MSEESGDVAVKDLTDEIVDDPGTIGPIELKFRGRWMRVENALKGLPHEMPQYSWRFDSTGRPAVFIEVPVRGGAGDGESLLLYRDSIRKAIAELEPGSPVYVHFLGADGTDT